jgi:thiazole synthase
VSLKIGDREFQSRLFLGTGKFSSNQAMKLAVVASGSELVTVALKRVEFRQKSENDELLSYLQIPSVNLLPNTSGVRDAKEAILLAELARDALETNLLKLEIHPDPRYLLPDPIETLKATEVLAKKGFIILPYINADPVLCKRLEDVGASAVMPLGSPIGSNSGLQTKAMLEIIIEQSQVPVIVDAGIGAPSHASEALEMGADAVLVNTAIAVAGDPTRMAQAFRMAVEAGRMGYEAQLGAISKQANATSPLTSFLSQSSVS